MKKHRSIFNGVQSSSGKTVPVRNASFIPRPRRPKKHYQIDVFLTTIPGLDHDLMQLLKTSERKMVMYNIASNLNGILRRMGKAYEWKLTAKSRQVKIKLTL